MSTINKRIYETCVQRHLRPDACVRRYFRPDTRHGIVLDVTVAGRQCRDANVAKCNCRRTEPIRE